MIDSEEFPFVTELPNREAKRLVSFWDRYEEFKSMIEGKGPPIPPAVAAKLLDVSRQRVDELMRLGRLERLEFAGHPFVTDSSIRWLAEQDRSPGRRPGPPESKPKDSLK